MTWKAWAAIVAALLIAFLVFTYVTRQQWVKRDVERLMQIERLQEEAEQHGKDAEAAKREVADAQRAAADSYDALVAAESDIDALRVKVRHRPRSTSSQELSAQLAEADTLIVALEDSLTLAHQPIETLYMALSAAGRQASALELQVVANEQAWLLERKRSETWLQQTKRGKVKTAFLAIGSAAAGGFAGYGVGVATQ